MAIYCVILAGGSGERLWPLSHAGKPKQLLQIGAQQTLLEQAIERVKSIVSKDCLWICTTSRHADSIKQMIGNNTARVLVEPASCNTGPAILLSCMEIYEKDPQALVLFLPADSFIPEKDTPLFLQYLEHVFDCALLEQTIVLLGVKPLFAATGYGYIEFLPRDHAPYSVFKFYEKPSKELAELYMKSSTMLWNIGMFCARVDVFVDAFKHLAPTIYDGVVQYRAGLMSYDAIQSESFDYAILEKSNNLCVLPVDFSWCDVGSLETFLSLKEQYGQNTKKKVLQIDSNNNLIDVSDKLVALIGVQDLCVVETEQVLLITKREDVQKVRAMVHMLKQGAFEEYL